MKAWYQSVDGVDSARNTTLHPFLTHGHLPYSPVKRFAAEPSCVVVGQYTPRSLPCVEPFSACALPIAAVVRTS